METDAPPLIQLRPFVDEDFPAFLDWLHGHGHPGIPPTILPKLGVVVTADEQPVAMLFLYMDNSCGVAFLEHAVTAPGTSLAAARAAMRAATGYLEDQAHSFGYIIICATTLPAVARTLSDCGYNMNKEGMTTTYKVLVDG